MSNVKSKIVAECLAARQVHNHWEESHLTDENEPFYKLAYDFILEIAKPSKAEPILDAGCGPCFHAIRLAKRGFLIHAVDFSEFVLERAQWNVTNCGLEDRVIIRREDLTAVSYPDESFRYIWCWGVLMHVPEIGKAIAELCRITKPGGYIVLSENNSHSLQAMALMCRTRLGIGETPGLVQFSRTEPGFEYWIQNEAGTHVTRHSNFRWMILEFKKYHFDVRTHVAGQFTEHFLKFPPGRIRRAIHSWNSFWFQSIRIPSLSFGNILILKKQPC